MSTSEASAEESRVDGRRARRERGRDAVVDALFELLREGGRPPDVDQVAERAGVSVSSVFRYFGSIEDLQRQAFDRLLERFRPMLAISAPSHDTTDARVRVFVEARIRFYEATGAILRVGRARAVEHPQLARSAIKMKQVLAEQVRDHFAVELDRVGGAAAGEDLALVVDSLTSPEVWDILVLAHGRSRRQVQASWEWVVRALLERAESDPVAGPG